MFWQAASFCKPSPIEQILEKESYTLEELLDEDDLIQEAKSLNGRLVDFLKQPETVARLVSLIVDPTPESTTGMLLQSSAPSFLTLTTFLQEFQKHNVLWRHGSSL